MSTMQLDPIISDNQVIGVLSPYYVICQNNQQWNNVKVRLWIWKGDILSVVDTEPSFILTKYKINDDDDRVEINISDYVLDTIDPVFNAFNADSNSSDNSFFYYEIDFYNNSSLIDTFKSKVLLGTMGWRYDYQDFDTIQDVGGGYLPSGKTNDAFGSNNLDSKINYFEYPSGITEVPNRLWYTTRPLPISNSNNSVKYNDDLVSKLSQSQIKCTSYNYGLAFLNKVGNWDVIPMFGKVTSSITRESSKYNRGFRYKTDFTKRYQSTVMEVDVSETVRYTVNTGIISEVLSDYLESILFSPRLFIVDYDTNISYPVVLDDSTLTRKRYANDRINIQHTLSFVGNNNKRLNW